MPVMKESIITEEHLKATAFEPLPKNFKDATSVDKLICAVRNLVLRMANKAGCFFTIRSVAEPKYEKGSYWDYAFEDQAPEYVETHWVGLPQIIYAESDNPLHQLHIKCMIMPPITIREHRIIQIEIDLIRRMKE